MMYTDFSNFTRDQEFLISIKGPNYVEGSLLTDKSPPNNWRSSSFYKSSHQSKINKLLKSNHGLLYSIELVMYYDDHTAQHIDEVQCFILNAIFFVNFNACMNMYIYSTYPSMLLILIDFFLQEIKLIMDNLSFIPGFVFKKDVELADFLERVGSLDGSKSEEVHPWLNLFVPKSRVDDFNTGVLVNILGKHNQTRGPILFYPFNKKKYKHTLILHPLLFHNTFQFSIFHLFV